MDDIDLLDRKILYELDCNGRASYSQIAKVVRSSKTTVKYRIEKMLKEKLILGFHTVINIGLLGYSLYRVYIKLKNCPPDKEKEIIDYLIKENKVYVLFKVNGPHHLVLGVKSKNIWDFKEFWDKFNNSFFDYLGSKHISILTDYIEFSRSYLLKEPKEKKQFITLKKPDNFKIDEIDNKILDYLSNNGRASLIEIAKHLGKTVMVGRHRLKSLEKKKIIVGYRATLNHEKLGYHYYKVDMNLSSNKNLKQIRQFILSNSNVIYTEKSIITADFEFDLEVKDFIEFTKIMDSFKAKFPDDIRDYNYYSLVKGYKIF